MADLLKCPRCGAEMPPDAAEGLCPRCLARMAFGKDEELDQEAEGGLDSEDAATGDREPATDKVEAQGDLQSIGSRIGRYKLLERIGEGGFGVVYMAEQVEPVQRKVALKIVKAGMDTREVIARFEAERQALALMDHPNIARVFDGGVTDTGRPYFVMELVRGIPLTELPPSEARLRPRPILILMNSPVSAHPLPRASLDRILAKRNG